MTIDEEVIASVTTAYEVEGLFADTVVEVNQLPCSLAQVDFLRKVFGIQFFACTKSGIVRQLAVPSDSIPYPKSVIAALTTSPDSPVNDPNTLEELVSVLTAIERIQAGDCDVSAHLGVDKEDLRLTTMYRSETDSRIVHYPLTDEEKSRLKIKLEFFLSFRIQTWLLERIPEKNGPIFFRRPADTASSTLVKHIASLFTGSTSVSGNESPTDWLFIKDVVNLLGTTSSNRVVRELVADVMAHVVQPTQPVTGWGGIRQRRRGVQSSTIPGISVDPISRKIQEIIEWSKSKRFLDQSIVMHDFSIFSKNQEILIKSVFRKYLSQHRLLEQKPLPKLTLSSASTRAPPSIDESFPPFFPKHSIPESFRVAQLNHEIETLNSQLASHDQIIADLRHQLSTSRASIRSKDHIIAELTNHCIRMKAHLFAYSEEIEDGTAVEEYEFAKMWTEIEKLRIEKNWLTGQHVGSGQSAHNHSTSKDLRIRDEIIDLLNFIIVRIGGFHNNIPDEVRFAVSKIRDLMANKATGGDAPLSCESADPPPTDSQLLDQYTNTYFP